MAEHSGEKSQDPTPHRRQQARQEGQVAKSQDLCSALLLLLGLLALLMTGPTIGNFFAEYARAQLGAAPPLDAGVDHVVSHWRGLLATLARTLLPLLALLLVGAIVIDLAQVGFLFLPEKLTPDLSRIDPLKGFGRIFSMSNVMRLIFGLFKIGVVAGVGLAAVYQERDALLGLSAMALPQLTLFLFQVFVWTAIKMAAALALLAVLDYGYQWWRHEQDLKMTPQEVREEMRNLEGDPQVIARRRAVQRQLVTNRLSTAVPKADFVLANPTHLAIAVQYDPQTMRAPIVVAKGAGMLAARIRQLALEHGIPVIERKPLAQALYREVEVNHPVPEDKYAAIAEILAYVYQLKGKKVPGAA